MITFENVTHAYDGHVILQNLSYIFPESGIVALMGASGIGKTTLLRLACGLEKPQSGKIVNHYERVAVSFQEPRLVPWLTVKENVDFVLDDTQKESGITERLLAALELSEVANALPDALSGGMKQRTSLARALATGADLLLLDEPFSALDDALKARVIALVRESNKDGLTLVITHDEKEAEALGASVLTLTGSPVKNLMS